MTDRELFKGQFRGRTVLVTGHTGFKGSWLSIWLNLLGAQVVGFSRDPRIDPKIRNFSTCRLDQRIAHCVGDVEDLRSLRAVMEEHQPQLVIHMAAQALVPVAYQDPVRTFDTNARGTVNVLEAVRATSSVAAFVGVTTDKVYEDQHWPWGYRENDVLGGYDPYAASKSMAELAIQSYRRSSREKWFENGREHAFAKHPTAIASVRAGNVLGGGDFSSYRLVPDCVRAILSDMPVELRRPKAIRPWQHVLEPLSGYLWLAAKLLQDPSSSRYAKAWNFGPREEEIISCEALVRELIRQWGKGDFRCADVAAPKPHETSVLKLNWSQATAELGWKPTYTWHEALEATVEWYQEYERQGGGAAAFPESIDLYNVCCRQIEEYTARATAQSACWAPKPG